MILRPMRITDAETLSELAREPAIWEKTQRPFARSLEEWRDLIDLLADRPWCFTAEHDGEIVGAFSMIRQDGQYAHRSEIGGWLGRPFWGKGFATEAFKQMIAFGSRNGLVRIEARGADDNPAVIAAGVKAGMRLEAWVPCGIKRGSRLLNEYLYVWIKGVDRCPG